MSHQRNKDCQRGFTVQEMLLVILLSVILLALSLVGIVTYLRHLQIQELDNGAREIFLAAQNRAILLSGGQRLEGYVVKEGESNKIEHVDVLPDLAETGETTQITVYYIHSTDSTAMDQLLPQGTIDPTLREGDFYIVYEPESASVVDVFYSDDETGLPVEGNFETFYQTWRAADKKLRMDNRPMIGYYGGEAAESGTTISLRTPVINIYNNNELKVEVTYWVPRTLTMIGEGNDVSLTVELAYRGETIPLNLAEAEQTETPETSYIGHTYTWTLDSLTEGKQFKNLFSTLNTRTYGGDFTISAEVFYTGELKVNGARKTATDNSLFATDSGEETAYISCLRHLQNLDKTFSGVAGKTAAEQTGDIDPVENYTFQPVNNAELESYDGKGFTIDDLTIEADDTGNAGLFGKLEGREGSEKTLQNIQLVNTTVTGGTGSTGVLVGAGEHLTLTNCQVYWENRSEQTTNLREVLGDNTALQYQVTGTGSVGGLAGSLTDATLEHCAAATLVENKTGPVGGLVGSGSGLTIESSYGANYLHGPTAGGLVGNLTDTANITASYAVGFIDSGTSGTAAGLCLGTGTAQVTGSYSAMLFTVGRTNYPLCQSGTYTQTHYLDSDRFGFVNGNGNGTSYADLTNPAKWSELFGSGTFASKGAARSHPYNLQTTLSLTTYIYPGLADLDHWGDWGAQFQNGSLVYYEQYADGSYGFSGGEVSHLSDQTVKLDGYAVAYKGTPEISSIGATLRVTYQTGGWTTTTTQQQYGSTNIREIKNVADTTGQTDSYYLLPLPDEVVNSGYASQDFYQKITISDTQKEKSYYYNPHFANAILPYEDGTDLGGLADQLRAELRSPRHLYRLSLHQEYYNNDHQYRFLQQLDLDYTTYTGYGLFSGGAEQTPIGVGPDLPFRGNYYGNCHQISGVQVQEARTDSRVAYTYVGLFGYTTGVLQDVVYQMPNTLAVTSVGSSETRYVGGLVGYNGGTITNCAAFDVQLKAEGYQYSTLYLGGLVGCNEGTLRRSAAEGAAITADTSLSNAFAGGLVGLNENVGNVDQCYAVGKVSASWARHGEVYACGFAGRSEGGIYRSYAAVGLTVSGDAKAFGFCADDTTGCVYLNNGNFTYRGQHYAAQYADPAATAVTWTELTGKTEKEEVTNLGMHNPPVKVYNATETYPYPGIVMDGAKDYIHYGQWPDSMDLGEMGIYYWEKMTIDGKDTYYLSAISQKDGQVYQSGTLSTAHGDGGVVTEYGYGYFYAANTGEPTLESSGIGFSNSNWFAASPALENGAANTALSALLDGKYTFRSYNTWGTNTANQGLFTIQSGDAKDWSGEPPYGTWTLTRGGVSLKVQLNPFFANAMSCDKGSEGSGVSKALPGTEDNPYEVRAIDQLQFINWNHYAHSTTKQMNTGNMDRFPYLSYGSNVGRTVRAYYWEQTHDLEGKEQTAYTPIAAVYDEKTTGREGGDLFGWFGGMYDGNDYLIADVNIAGPAEGSSCVGLFGAVYNGTLKNIVLYSEDGNATVTGTNSGTSQWYVIGGLAGLAGSSTGSAVVNCTVSGYTIQDNHTSSSQNGWGGTGVGGLIGICDMDLVGCTAVTEIAVNSRNSDNVRIGGLVGSCQGSISSCYAGGRIQVDKNTQVPADATYYNIYVGGIVGGIYMKPLRVGGGNADTVGRDGQDLQNNLRNCYSYVELPAASSHGRIKGLYAVGGSGELDRQDGNLANHGWTNYYNNYYLESVVMKNNSGGFGWGIRNDLNSVTSMTYAQMADTTSDDGLLNKLNANINEDDERFSTVTTETAGGAPLNGRYSFGSDPSLLGKDYPFPTILTQSSDVAKNGIANVHYGDWPLEGIRRPDGALPVNLDLFADYQENLGAVHTESLTLSGVSEGGAWNAVSADEEIVKAEINDGTLTITALKEGNTTVTVTYTLHGDVYSLTIEVNVTAQLRLAVASGVTTPVAVFPNATVTTPLALTDKEGTVLPDALKAQITLNSIDVEFDPDYFTGAAVEQDEEEGSLTLTAASGTKTGPSQMTAAYEFTYLAEEYSATSVLSLRVVDAGVEVKPLTIALDGEKKKSQEYTGTGDSEFTIRVNDSDITVTDLQIVAFEEVAAEYKDVIWAAWAEEETGTQTPGILTVTAYEQSTYPYPAYASVRLQYQFTYQGSTHTMWQDLAVTVTNQKETEGVVTP